MYVVIFAQATLDEGLYKTNHTRDVCSFANHTSDVWVLLQPSSDIEARYHFKTYNLYDIRHNMVTMPNVKHAHISQFSDPRIVNLYSKKKASL